MKFFLDGSIVFFLGVHLCFEISHNRHHLQVKSETNSEKSRRMLALRSLLSLLLLESFLEPGSTDDIAAELAICCSRAFPDLQQLSTIAPAVEVEEGSEEAPPLMDVLLDVSLSLLPKASLPVREAVEKVSLSIRYTTPPQHQCPGPVCPYSRPFSK